MNPRDRLAGSGIAGEHPVERARMTAPVIRAKRATLMAMAPSADRSWGFLTRGFSQKTGNLAGLTRQTDTELLRLFFENGMMHTTELAAALDLTEDEISLRMEYLQKLGAVEYTPVPEHPRNQN